MIFLLPILQYLGIAACIAVDSDTILMRDLAKAIPKFAGAEPEVSLGPAPSTGAIRRFTPQQIQALAISSGVPEIDAQEVCFQRATAVLTKAQLIEALNASLGAQQVRVEILDFSRFPMPKGEVEFTLQGLSMPQLPNQPIFWRGALRDGSHRIPLWVRVRLVGQCTRAFATRPLRTGEEILPDGIRFETGEGYPAHPSCVAPSAVIGKVSRRSITSGGQVVPAMLDYPLVVRRGETIALESRMQGILLRIDTIAEANARAGDQIVVRNPTSGRRLAARVEAPGKALLVNKSRIGRVVPQQTHEPVDCALDPARCASLFPTR